MELWMLHRDMALYQAMNFITAYMVGTFGRIGTDLADNMCISLLLPDRLKDQFCFRTKEALDKLQYLESEKIWL